MQKTSKKVNWLVISFAVLVFFSVLIWLVSTSCGSIRIKEVKILGGDGLTYSVDVYVPKTATNADPAPLVIWQFGGGSEGDFCATWGTELARRGYVVVLSDGAGRGSSQTKSALTADIDTSSDENKAYRMTEFSRNVFDAVIDFPFIDRENVTVIGHSIGSNIATGLTQYETQVKGRNIKNLILLEGMGWSSSTREKLGNTNVYALLSLKDHYWRGYTDESAQAKVEETMAGFFDGAVENPTMGTMYGDPQEGGSTCVRWTTKRLLHGSAPFVPSLKTDVIEYLQTVSPAPNPIDAGNIVSVWRDIFGGFAIAAMVWFIIEVTLSLVKTKFFSSLKTDIPRNIGIEKSSWISTTIVSIIGGVVIFVLVTSFVPVPTSKKIWNVDQYIKLVPYLMIIPLLDVVSFYFLFHLKKKREGLANAKNYGIAFEAGKKGPGWANVGKAALLGALVSAIVVGYLNFIKANFGINIQMTWLEYSSVNLETVLNCFPWILLYLWLFSVGQLSQNVVRRSVGLKNENLDVALSVFLNVLIAAAPMAIVALTQVIALNWHSSIFKATNIQTFYGMPLGLAVSTTIHTVLYRKTGTIWVGMFVCGIFMALMMCSGMMMTSMFLIG